MASSSKKGEKDKNQHIQVYVRCRPVNYQERDHGSSLVVEVSPDCKEVMLKEKIAGKDLTKRFTFDKVFGPNSNQVDVYKTVASPMIDEVLMGYNCTVFAYGQTGTGKTYTMEGGKSGALYTWDTDPKSGLIPRTFQHLFEVLGKQELEYNVRVSYLELYNEELFDLLGPVQEMPKLRLYEDSTKKGSVVIQGLSEAVVLNKDEVYSILEQGAERKRMAFTQMNDASSRSHTVFSITVHIKESTLEGEDLVKIGKLNLVDLAGSECIGRSGAVDKRAREAGNINQSLLTLGRVITALVEKAPHIPYRESKLTRLLQDSLGGRTKTSIIATVSPASMNSEETNSTLEYAHRAKNITNKPEVNQKMTKRALIKEYTEEIERLRRDLLATREKNGVFVDEENYNSMRALLSNQSEAIKEKIAQIEALIEQKEKLNALVFSTNEKLKEKDRELQETTMKLNNTKGILKQRETKLRVTELEREEQKHLVDKQTKTEKCLKSQAEQLLQVAKGTTNDLAGLFSKLDRKSGVELTNKELVQNFQATFHKEIAILKSKVHGMMAIQEEWFKNFQQSLGSSASNLEQHIQKNSDFLQHLFLDEMTYLTSNENCLSKMKENVDQQLDDIVATQTHYQAELALPSIQEQKEASKTLVAHSNQMFSHHCQQTKEMTQALTEGLLSLSSSLSHVDQMLSQETKKMNEILAERERQVQEETKEEQETFEACLSMMNKYRQGRLQAYKKADKTLREAATSTATFLEDQQLRITTELQPALTMLKTDVVERSEDTRNQMSRSISQTVEKLEKSGTQLSALEDNLSRFINQQAERFASQRTSLETFVQDVSQSIMEQKETLKTRKSEQEEALQKETEVMSRLVKDQRDLLQDHFQEIKENCHQLETDISGVDSMVLHLVEKDFKADISTGLTPVRKDYTFPHYLASTAPHQQILDQFRKTMDLSAAVHISIPESPVKVPDSVEEQLVSLKAPDFDCDASDTASECSEFSVPQARPPKETKENKSNTKRTKSIPKRKRSPNVKKIPLRSPNQ